MRTFILIISALIFSLNSCGQNHTEYRFPDIALRIKIPSGYIIQDTFPKHKFLDENNRQITDTVKLKELQAGLWKTLLIVTTADYNNTSSFNIVTETQNTGDFKSYLNFLKDMQKLMAKQQMPAYDTLESTLHVGNFDIYKFITYSIGINPIHYSGFYFAKVRNYFLVIKTDYIEKKFGEDIEKAILTSKFH